MKDWWFKGDGEFGRKPKFIAMEKKFSCLKSERAALLVDGGVEEGNRGEKNETKLEVQQKDVEATTSNSGLKTKRKMSRKAQIQVEMWKLGWASVGEKKRKAQIEEEMWKLIVTFLRNMGRGYSFTENGKRKLKRTTEAMRDFEAPYPLNSSNDKIEQLESNDEVEIKIKAHVKDEQLIQENEDRKWLNPINEMNGEMELAPLISRDDDDKDPQPNSDERITGAMMDEQQQQQRQQQQQKEPLGADGVDQIVDIHVDGATWERKNYETEVNNNEMV